MARGAIPWPCGSRHLVGMETFFDFEHLDVYQAGRELNRELTAIIADLPRGAGEAADNLRRAGLSITRNIAEANGKWTGRDKRQRYHIARGSAMEVGASLDELVDLKYASPARVLRAKALASRIVSMLMGLIRTTRDPEPPSREAAHASADTSKDGSRRPRNPATTRDPDRDPDRRP